MFVREGNRALRALCCVVLFCWNVLCCAVLCCFSLAFVFQDLGLLSRVLPTGADLGYCSQIESVI